MKKLTIQFKGWLTMRTLYDSTDLRLNPQLKIIDSLINSSLPNPANNVVVSRCSDYITIRFKMLKQIDFDENQVCRTQNKSFRMST